MLASSTRQEMHDAETILSPADPSEPIELHSAAFYDLLSKPLTPNGGLRLCLDQYIEKILLKQIRRFARHGGPELRDLRGFPAPADDDLVLTMNNGNSSPGKASSAYDGNFEQHLRDSGIYMSNPNIKPSNLEEIRQRLAKPRPSLSLSRFSEDAFESFQQVNDEASSEEQVARAITSIICGSADILNGSDLIFTKLMTITGGKMVNPKPDFYDGICPDDIDEQVRKDLGDYILPSTHAHAPAVPNLFTEFKRPQANANVAKRQVCLEGALGARGMHQLQSYGSDGLVYDNCAYTISATYHDGTLKLYTTHPIQPAGPGDSPKYQLFQCRSFSLTDTLDTFLDGVTAFRNGRELAMEWRDSFISVANGKARSWFECTTSSC